MLTIHTKRHIRLMTVEKPTAWIVYAVCLETTGSETVQVGESRIVRVIPKETVAPALRGSIAAQDAGAVSVKAHSKTLALPGTTAVSIESVSAIPSPYSSSLSKENLDFILWFSARPPTFAY